MERIPLSELKKRLAPFVNYEQEVQLSKEASVQNVGQMINSHLQVLEGNSGNRAYMPYYDRLITLLTILEAGWE